MRTRYALGIAAVCLAILASGCNPDKNKLYFKPQVGSKRVVDTEDAINYTMKVMGMELGFGFSRENTFEMATQSVDDQGVSTIEVTYKSVDFEITGLDAIMGAAAGAQAPGAPKLPGMPTGDDPFGIKGIKAATKGIEGEKFTVKVNKLGEIVEVNRADAISEKLAKSITEPVPGSPIPSREMFHNFAGDDAIKTSLESVFLTRPDQPMKAGGTWQDKSVNDSLAVPVTLDGAMTVKERANGVATVDSVIQLSFDMSKGPMQDALKTAKIEVSGQGNGTTKIDEATGWVNDAVQTAQITGNISFEAPGGRGQFSMPLEAAFKSSVRSSPA